MSEESVEEVIAEEEEIAETESEEEIEESEEESHEESTEETDEESEDLVITLDDEPEEAPSWVKELRQKNREKNKRIRELEDELKKTKVASKDVELGKKPHPDDYEYGSEKYEQDLADWLERKKSVEKKELEAKAEEERRTNEWQANLDRYEEKKKELKVKNFDDIEDSIRDELNITQQGIIIQAAENPAMIIYALGTNPKKAKEIASITDPVKFAVAIGRMETKMKVKTRKAATDPEPKVTSKGGSSSPMDNVLEKLRAEAVKSGDYTKVNEYKRKQKNRS